VSAILLAAALVAAATGVATPARGADLAARSVAPRWVHFDAPLWDIADEGLLFRLTYGIGSREDWLGRLLRADEARWMFSLGYARVYHSYDRTTRIFKNPGGHAALASAGRQWRWRLPEFAGAWTPRLAIEVGGHVASRRFPADGTQFNVKAIAGLEWIFRAGQPREWSAGVMWPHFSNANLFSRNAGYDALALRFGWRR
jgi:hypothetical protein